MEEFVEALKAEGALLYFDKWNVGSPERTTTATNRWYSFHGKFIVTDNCAIVLSANFLITPELDSGPPITYCEYSISDDQIQPLWEQWKVKREEKSLKEIQETEGETEPLFREIRRRGVKRELPLIVATLRAAAAGDFFIVDGEVMARGRKLMRGFDLTDEIERAVELEIA